MSDQEEIDRISGLPDELIVHILSLLPSTKQRLRTSLISRRWSRLSSAAPVLEFPAADFPISGDYAAAVDQCLRLSSAQSLLRLFVDDVAPPPSYDRWIRFAASRSVLHLALALHSSIKPLPPSLFLCFKSLTSLKLIRCKFPPLPPNYRGFPALKTLHLTSVDVSDNSMATLLSSCPRLEALHLCYCDKLSRLDISSASNPCLTHLSLLWINGSVMVEAPSLRFLDFDGDVSRLQVREVPNLHATQIVSHVGSNKDRRGWMQLASAVLDVKVLAVSCWFFEFMLREDGGFLDDGPPMMMNLKELHWFGVCITEKNLRALIFCLRECPMLEKLCIHLDYREELNKVLFEHALLDAALEMDAALEADLYFDPYDPYHMAYGNSEGDSSLQPCKSGGHPLECDCDELFLLHVEGHPDMLARLKAVTVTQFSNHRFGMQLVGFILRKAVVLELLQLTIMPDNKVELELLRKQLYCFSIASPHVQIEVSVVLGRDQPRDYKVMDAKRLNKEALQNEVGLPVDSKIPVIIFIGKLEEQKGSDILAATIPEFIDENVQIIILGNGKNKLEEQLEKLEVEYPDKARGVTKFNENRMFYEYRELQLKPSGVV